MSGEWRVVSGEWRVASGEWRVASGKEVLTSHLTLHPSHNKCAPSLAFGNAVRTAKSASNGNARSPLHPSHFILGWS